MGRVGFGLAVGCAVVTCAIAAVLVGRRVQSRRRWRRAVEVLREFEEGCATSIGRLRQVVDARAVEMHAGLASDGGSKLKMLLTFIDRLPDGCKTGKHMTEKPVTKIVSAKPQKPVPVPSAAQNREPDDSWSRCRQGFFCSDHGSQSRPSKPTVAASKKDDHAERPAVPPVKKIVDLNEPQICRNKGCGKTFKEKDNHETACEYHPGPAIFHDRTRGWKCCDIRVKEFDEFMNIPPCTKGWHNADAA